MYAENIEVPAEPLDIMIRFKEVKLDETVAVIHKHTFGKCEGILKATLTHVTYETDHKDAFPSPGPTSNNSKSTTSRRTSTLESKAARTTISRPKAAIPTSYSYSIRR